MGVLEALAWLAATHMMAELKGMAGLHGEAAEADHYILRDFTDCWDCAVMADRWNARLLESVSYVHVWTHKMLIHFIASHIGVRL